MKVKILKSGESDSSVARTLSNMLLNNYKKGLAISNNEASEESGVFSPIGVDPTQTVKMKTQNSVSIGGPAYSKGYKVKAVNASMVPNSTGTTSSSFVKEFISQSKALDSELDHVVAQMKLNNKDEFYGGGFRKDYKEYLRDKSSDEEQQRMLDKLIKKLGEQEENGEDTTDTYEKMTYLIYLMKDTGDVIRDLGRYNKSTPEDKEIVKDVLSRGKDFNEDTLDALRELGYDIERTRSKATGKLGKLNEENEENVLNTYTDQNHHIKSKKGIRVIGDVDVSKLGHELLMLSIEKIANIITLTLTPLAQKLYDSHFQGLTLQDKNTTIPQLYQDMDEKLYILTTLNNQSNSQLKKLDKDFDKLYNLVQNGLNMYVMPTGGSMQAPKGYVGGQVRTSTNYLYEL